MNAEDFRASPSGHLVSRVDSYMQTASMLLLSRELTSRLRPAFGKALGVLVGVASGLLILAGALLAVYFLAR